MSRFELFPDNKKVGVFRGFRDGGMEFRADLTLPFRPEFQKRPMHGGFVLVELDKPDEAILGRIEPPWYSWRVGLLVSNRLVVGL